MWSSSLTDSTLRGKPDNQSVDISSRINGLNDIRGRQPNLLFLMLIMVEELSISNTQ